MALDREVEHPGWTVGNSLDYGPTSFDDEVPVSTQVTIVSSDTEF
jgi:hypothetical protein